MNTKTKISKKIISTTAFATILVIFALVLTSGVAFATMHVVNQTAPACTEGDLGALSPDDLPGPGEELVITSDDVLIIHEGETAELGGKLIVRGTGGVRPTLQIENRGEFTINGSIESDNAEMYLHNNGTLNMYGARIENTEGGTLYLTNNGKWNINDSVLSSLGANTNIGNDGEINAYNWSLIDESNGTNILSTGSMLLNDCIFSAGTGGRIDLANMGSIRLCQSGWEANDGGRFNINTGEIVFHKSYVRASGASHGRRSQINILSDNVTLNYSSFENIGASFNYGSSGISNMYGSRIENTESGTTNWANNGEWNINDSVLFTSGATTNMVNDGDMRLNWSSFENIGAKFSILNIGTLEITNGGIYTSSCGKTNLFNNGELYGNGWLVTCECDGEEGSSGEVHIGNVGNITFCVPFIEGVSARDLTSIGPGGRSFPQGEFCIINLYNNGTIREEAVVEKLLDALITKVNATEMPNIIKRRLIDKLEYAKALVENAKIAHEAGNDAGAKKYLGVAKSQVESFASMVRITRRISSEDKASFLAESTEIIGKIDRLIEHIETEHRC